MFQKKQKEAVRNCGVAANGFPTFSCFTMSVPNLLFKYRAEYSPQSSRVDITSVGSESEVDGYWYQARVLHNTDQ